MLTYNIGSIALDVGNQMGWNTLVNISGTALNAIIQQEINFCNSYTNVGIDGTNIDPKFQPVIIDLSISKAMLSNNLQQGLLNDIHLGDLNISLGRNVYEIANVLRENAIQRLQELGRYARWKRVICS